MDDFEEWQCLFYNMHCYEVPEQIVTIDEDTDEVECDAVCDLDCEDCTWKEYYKK